MVSIASSSAITSGLIYVTLPKPNLKQSQSLLRQRLLPDHNIDYRGNVSVAMSQSLLRQRLLPDTIVDALMAVDDFVSIASSSAITSGHDGYGGPR